MSLCMRFHSLSFQKYISQSRILIRRVQLFERAKKDYKGSMAQELGAVHQLARNERNRGKGRESLTHQIQSKTV